MSADRSFEPIEVKLTPTKAECWDEFWSALAAVLVDNKRRHETEERADAG